MPVFIVSLLVQLALVVHVLKTGRNVSWVFILLFFPLIGTLAYVIVELLPEWTQSRSAHRARRSVGRTLNPNRALHQASRKLAVADTVQNAVELAQEHLRREQFEDARAVLERCRRGIHADDPQILSTLARAQFGLGDFAETIATLDRLKATNPEYRSPEAHLLYARAQEGAGHVEQAIHEFEALTGYYAGPEPVCRLAQLLMARGEPARARELFRQVLNEAELAGRHYRTLHRAWIELAKQAVQERGP